MPIAPREASTPMMAKTIKRNLHINDLFMHYLSSSLAAWARIRDTCPIASSRTVTL
ncbi:hypothetical protein CNECB9_1950047 [Cupriavidus necator]|uniref:Uncharacterized protein n=1 Tax=Cupriavidus necator TaxID=106590 RepID=A0A1K0J6J3_CUPNE|nr:hypothetical protein CNECB9_1950047 [Cupriavidus necator]